MGLWREWKGSKDLERGELEVASATMRASCNWIQLMNVIHSPAQYELQFNKWKARKNLTANDWRLILRFMDQCSEDQTKCAVYLNGELVSPLRLRKKRTQYYRGQERTRCHQQRGKL